MTLRILLINPNTSAHITARLAVPARRMLREGDSLDTCTAETGPVAIINPAQASAAADMVQQLSAREGVGYDAIILGVSLDCGLAATRVQQSPQIVIGMTEAACIIACLQGSRFGVLTLGSDMAPLYESHVRDLGLAERLVGVAAPNWPQAYDQSADEVNAGLLAQLEADARQLCSRGAHTIVLAGAVLCGYGEALTQRLGRPVLEGTACAVSLAQTCAVHEYAFRPDDN